jgi:hypothetical protein
MNDRGCRRLPFPLWGFAVLVWMALCGALCCASAWAGEDEDAHAIAQVIKVIWERPDNPVDVRPVAVSGGFAVAGWIAGERGGRALLKKQGDAWHVVLCSGDGIRTAWGLVAAGVPEETAAALEITLAGMEAGLPADVVKKFSLFEGSVPVESGAPPAHDHHD